MRPYKKNIYLIYLQFYYLHNFKVPNLNNHRGFYSRKIEYICLALLHTLRHRTKIYKIAIVYYMSMLVGLRFNLLII